MEKVVSIASRTKEDSDFEMFEFMNSFGFIFKSKVFIPQYSQRMISLDSIRRVEVRRRRKYKNNLLALMIAATIIAIAYTGNWPLFGKYIIGVISLIPISIGLVHVDYEYKFLIVRGYDVIEFPVNRLLKDDAKKLAVKINKKLCEPKKKPVIMQAEPN